mgnify:CR=1 FL=1
MTENYEAVKYRTAEDFLSALRPSHKDWVGKNWTNPWIFRGHGDASWSLTPSAWRRSESDEAQFQSILKEIDDTRIKFALRDDFDWLLEEDSNSARLLVAQRRFEFWQAQTFSALADEIGAQIPGGQLPKVNPWESRAAEGLYPRPHPAFALAQHHGMATRLLDWTRHPLFAAFFAAESTSSGDSAIAVWALQRFQLFLKRCWVEYEVPRSQIGFLHSQAGLFLYHQSADEHFVKHGSWPCVENDCEHAWLKKLVLPRSEASELRRLLFAEGVSRVHLMPTLDNIRATLQDVWRDVDNGEASS